MLNFFKNRGFKPRILHSDYYTIFRSTKVTEYYESKGCTHQSSAPYQQWQNSVERDIQTILANVSATIHGQDWLRADTWSYTLSHWARLHNSLPHSVHNDTPARLIDNSFSINAHHQYRFAFGNLLCFPLQEHEQRWRFDVKNDIGFYMGDADSIKGGSLVYMPYTHSTLVRGNGHRVLISDIQLLQWYSKRRDIRRNPLLYQHTKDSIMNLLADRETTAARNDSSQILVTPATDENDIIKTPLQPALVQHASTDTETA